MLVACQSSESGGDLNVGDCYNETQSVDANGDQVRAYSIVDCSTAHDGEVFSVLDYPNADVFPGYEAIGAFQQSQCDAAFQSYVGVPWNESRYTISYASPDDQGWASGDHTIHCLLSDGQFAPITGSVRGTGK